MERTHELVSNDAVRIPIEKISFDPNQPRRTFEEIESMAESIKTGGILHPIMVRPFGVGYMIIFGERRCRAAQLLGMTEIRATVTKIDITDEEVKVIQLIENIQREDVHPMQQAVAYKFLAVERGMTLENIALFIGKPVYYVRQQLKLNDLSEKWQDIFQKNGIPLSIALLICSLSDDAQKSLYSDRVDKSEAKKANPKIEISHSLINRYKGILSDASFEPADPTLDEKAGSCIGCPFNSASASLFPEDERKPHCNKIACFTNKGELHLKREITKVLADPAVVFVNDGYSYQEPELVRKMKEDGADVLKVGYSDDCRKVSPPERPEWNEFKKDNKGKGVSEVKQLFKKEEIKYEREFKSFEDNIALGKIRKALVLHSSSHKEIGSYVFVELTPKAPAKITKKAIESGNPTVEDVDNRIKEIQKGELRAKELDQEKVHRKIVEQVKEDKSLQAVPQKASKIDDLLIKFLLYESLGYQKQRELPKLFRKAGLESSDNPERFFQTLETVTKEQITYLLRQIIIGKYSACLPKSNGGRAMRLIAESLGSVPIAEFEQAQQEIAKNRQARKQREIAILNEMKKELIKNNKQNKSRAVTTKIKRSSAEKTKTSTAPKRA